ncbi:MAG: hypothetical protein R2710_05465 [Acidimicrobiales bacterium]
MIDGSAASGRERILDSSARLFACVGFAETSRCESLPPTST